MRAVQSPFQGLGVYKKFQMVTHPGAQPNIYNIYKENDQPTHSEPEDGGSMRDISNIAYIHVA
jgi:hypothetical protein